MLMMDHSSQMRDSQTNLRSSASNFNKAGFKLSKGDQLKQQQVERIMRNTINKSNLDEIVQI